MAARKVSAAAHAKREAAKERARFKRVKAARVQLQKIELQMQALEKKRAAFYKKHNEAEEKLRKRWEVIRNKAQ